MFCSLTIISFPRGLPFAVTPPQLLLLLLLLRSYKFDFRSVCMYLFLLAVFNPDWRDENEDMSFHSSLLVAEGMSTSLNDDEILNLSF